MPVEKSEFKKNKIIKLLRNDDDKFPFSFGLGKAKLIIENYEEIVKFVKENEK
jgi:hypothetical protein